MLQYKMQRNKGTTKKENVPKDYSSNSSDEYFLKQLFRKICRNSDEMEQIWNKFQFAWQTT